jgi:hypothetical protein
MGSTRWKQRSWLRARDTGGRRPIITVQKSKLLGASTPNTAFSDIADLLIDLNTGRKAETYGDVDRPEDLEAEDVASAVEEYVEVVVEIIQDTGEE